MKILERLTRTTATLTALGAITCVAGCADEEPTRRSAGGGTTLAHPSDAAHPGWRLHPLAIVLSDVDADAIYDVSVTVGAIRIPKAGHEALLASITPGKTVLIGRSNEDDPLKNPGFIRGVVSMREAGADAVLETVIVHHEEIILGHLNLAGPYGVRFVKPGTRASTGANTKSGQLALRARGDDLAGDVTWTIVDEKGTLKFPNIELGATKYGYSTGAGQRNLTIAASMDLSLETNMFLEVGVSGGMDFDPWNGDGGFCVDAGWFGKHCTGAPLVSGEAHLGVSYELGLKPTFTFNGKIEKSIDLPELKVSTKPGSCVIPPGLPCFVSGGLKGQASINVNGALSFTTDKPFRMYGVSDFGGKFRNFDVTLFTGSLPNFEIPTNIVPAKPTAALTLSELAGITSLNVESGIEASVEYGPFLKFGLGAEEVGDLYAEGTLRYKIGAHASICQNLDATGFTGAGTTAGVELKRGPEGKVTLGGELAHIGGISTSATLFSGYDTFAKIGTPGCGGAARPDGVLP